MRRLKATTTTLCFLVAVLLAGSAHAQPGFGEQKDALVGTWDSVLTFSDGTAAHSTLTVIPGRHEGEGSVIHAAEASFLLPNPTTPEQGVWEHAYGNRFVALYFGFSVDGTFTAPAGRIGFRHRITVSKNRERFAGIAIFEVLDTAGNVVFTDTVQTQGRRQHPDVP